MYRTLTLARVDFSVSSTIARKRVRVMRGAREIGARASTLCHPTTLWEISAIIPTMWSLTRFDALIRLAFKLYAPENFPI